MLRKTTDNKYMRTDASKKKEKNYMRTDAPIKPRKKTI
jgi:hypothetical protein